MFRIKICGVTRPDDVRAVVAAGADAVGLNFHDRSPRYASPDSAASLVREMPPGVGRVGVFVNAPLDFIRSTAESLDLTHVQLHGDERPECVAQLAGKAVIRAIRCRAGDSDAAKAWIAACRSNGGVLAGLLIDAYKPDQYGGTGAVSDWTLLGEFRQAFPGLPLVLAGGLTPENVGRAIAIARPDAVDTASGVETSPGIKDSKLVARFVREAKLALSNVTN